MTWRAPADACFQSILAEVLHSKDVLLHICEEYAVGFFTAGLERSANVLQEMNMADLHDAAGEHVLRSHTDGIIFIAGDRAERVTHILELCEELHHCLEILRGSEQADRNVMREVIHAVDERDLLIVAFHRHVLSIDHKRSTETLGIAVPLGDFIIVWDGGQFLHELSVRPADAFAIIRGKRTNAGTFQMRREHRFWRTAVIDAEPPITSLTEKAF